MGTPNHGPLAGMVSQEAEALYARLLAADWLPTGPGPDQVDPASTAARELVEARVAYPSPLEDDRLLPLAQPTAIQLLLARKHDEMTARHQQAMAGWELLDSILSANRRVPAPHHAPSGVPGRGRGWQGGTEPAQL